MRPSQRGRMIFFSSSSRVTSLPSTLNEGALKKRVRPFIDLAELGRSVVMFSTRGLYADK